MISMTFFILLAIYQVDPVIVFTLFFVWLIVGSIIDIRKKPHDK